MVQDAPASKRLKKLSQVLKSVSKERQTGPQPAFAEGEGPRQHDRSILQTVVDFTSESNFYTGITDNISEGGIFVATFECLGVGTRVQLEFSLPDAGPPVAVEGEVRWSREYLQDGGREVLPGMGLRFVGLKPADRERIEVFVSRRETIFYDDDEL
jgi:uncharacterized protein (TIGR02266 family)